MRRGIRRIICVLMSVALVLTVAPLSAFSKEEKTSAKSPVESSFSNNGLGGILNKLTEQESEENPDYQISFVEIEGKTATVNLNNKDACQLIVAIYDEITNQMLGSGVEQLEASSQTTSVDIDIDSMPEHFVCFAYLLDENYGSVCEKYECQRYSSAFDEFLKKEPEDFENKEILVFDDEKEQTDFAVLNDDVVTTSDSSMTYSYDEETLTYSFENITDEVRSLSAGDVFTYTYGDGASDFLVIKVKSISVSGNTATIVEDELTLADAFDFVRVDAEADFTDVEIDENELPEGMTLAEEEVHANAFMPEDNQLGGSGSDSFSTNFKLNLEDKNPNGTARGSISGSLGLTISVSSEFYYDLKIFDKDYYEFKLETKFEQAFNVSTTGEFSAPDSLRIPIPSFPAGPFDIDLNICPIIKISISANFSIKYNNKITLTLDSKNGCSKTNDASSDWDVDVNQKVEVNIGVSVELRASFNIPAHVPKSSGRKEVLGVGLKGAFYVKWSAQTSNMGEPEHTCALCLNGPLDLVVEGSLNYSIKLTEHLKFGGDLIKLSHSKRLVDNFYFSISSEGVKVGKGICPNRYAKVNFIVKDADTGKVVKGAMISSDDGKYLDTKTNKLVSGDVTTDKSGNATLYFKKGSHFYNVSKSSYPTKTGSLDALSIEKTITVKLTKTSTVDPAIDYSYNPASGHYTGDLLTFGSYPQTRVTDSSLISSLNAKSKSWVSYGYYTGSGSYGDGQMKPSNYMKYADISYNSQKYRAVTFTQYRPYYTGYTSSASYTYQDENGYTPNNVYYFKYEPLKWRILDPGEGLVMCESIIDSQAYNNYVLYANGEFWGDSAKTYYSSNWAKSSLRAWLNNDFYNTAFSSSEKNAIKTSYLENKSTYSSSYDAPSTYDKVFLLSYWDAINSNYGFSSSYSSYDTARRAQGTDYAKCQGLYVYRSSGSSYDGNSNWRLRSPYYSYNTWSVYSIGDVYDGCGTGYTSSGVRPALKFNPKSSIKKASAAITENLETLTLGDNSLAVTGEGTKNIIETSCTVGEKYIVLNVSGYQEKGFVLTSENLQYIGELTADENGEINEDILVKASVPNSVTILAGNFSDGTKVKYYCDHPCVIGNHNFTVTDYPASDSKTAYTSYECSVCGYYYEDWEEAAPTLTPKDGSGITVDTENGFILNVPQGTFDMDELLDYDGVELEYIETSNGFGTGTVMLVKSLDDGNILSSYTLVFNGDVTGDGFVDSFDVSVLSSVSNYEFEFDEYPALERAADLNNDGFIDTFDLSILNAMANFEI